MKIFHHLTEMTLAATCLLAVACSGRATAPSPPSPGRTAPPASSVVQTPATPVVSSTPVTVLATVTPATQSATATATTAATPPAAATATPPAAEATEEVEECRKACHAVDLNSLFGLGAKHLPANHAAYSVCLECHAALAKPALPATHLGRQDAACRLCHLAK